MRFFAVSLIFFGVAASHAQAPVVPHKMRFADMTLTIRDDARREIQKDVDALTRHPKYFDVKAERAKTYFPIITKIFEEENVPEDLKYLVLQESSLVADAVSVSNAVGFWQFKDFTAISMGMRVDKQIDERMNIASASRGAAQYLKQNNQQFDNWILALQAYQMGAGGVKRSVGDEHNGKRHFEVNADTYWYIKKFIAHKVAFEDAIRGEPSIKAIFIESKKRKSISELAVEMEVEEPVLKEYNRWVLGNAIPDDKPYVIVIPNAKRATDLATLRLSSNLASKAKPIPVKSSKLLPEMKIINGLRAIKTVEHESLASLTERGGITVSRFLKFNEMPINQPIEPGKFYFLERKKKSALTTKHQVQQGESLWAISQEYGIQVRKLKKWNHLSGNETITVGSTIWLDAKHAGQSNMAPLPDVPTEQVIALEAETFNWDTAVVVARAPIQEVTVQPVQEDPKEEPVRQPVQQVHIIVKGETLYSISLLYQVSVMDLIEWNKLSIHEKVKEGQKLLLYPANEAEIVHGEGDVPKIATDEMQLIHEVKESDTLYAIARQYGVTIKDLMDWNDKKELTVKKGEKIIVLKR
jgi:membrane-bound lytic murein transglycosylase D